MWQTDVSAFFLLFGNFGNTAVTLKKKKLNRDPPSRSLSPFNLFNHCTVFPWMLSVGGLVSGAPAPAPLWFRHGENERPSENTAAAVQSTSVGRWHYSLLRVITTHFGGENSQRTPAWTSFAEWKSCDRHDSVVLWVGNTEDGLLFT